jgi:hypothetical protein
MGRIQALTGSRIRSISAWPRDARNARSAWATERLDGESDGVGSDDQVRLPPHSEQSVLRKMSPSCLCGDSAANRLDNKSNRADGDRQKST